VCLPMVHIIVYDSYSADVLKVAQCMLGCNSNVIKHTVAHPLLSHSVVPWRPQQRIYSDKVLQQYTPAVIAVVSTTCS
jgi:hypothetical protein